MAKEVRYFSTRGGEETLDFEEAVIAGLAKDGGLYIPDRIPSLPRDWQQDWENYSFQELSLAILSLYIPQTIIPRDDLKKIVDNSYSTFSHPLTSPIRQLSPSSYLLELFHGPTLAFKDVALQFLGNLFEYFLKRRNAKRPADAQEKLTVLGATSGDTGSAAIAGLSGKESIQIFILHPLGRISPIQLVQMSTVTDENVFCVAVESSDFDQCQAMVKSAFSDREFNAKHSLAAINSINWARILAQITYYFSAFFQLPKAKRADVQFAVPTGNMGDILAGYYAKRMGLPMGKLVVATNENDILERVFRTGRYESVEMPRGEAKETAVVNGSSDGQQSISQVKQTHSPAMDILLSSNYERLLYYSAEETGSGKRADAQRQVRQWMDEMKRAGKVDLGEAVRVVQSRDFDAGRVSNEETLEQIRKYYAGHTHYVCDPHTAVGLAVQAKMAAKGSPDTTWMSLSTAHPAKFGSAVDEALDSDSFPDFDFRRDVMPESLKEMETMKKKIYKVKGEEGVRALIEQVQREGASVAISSSI